MRWWNRSWIVLSLGLLFSFRASAVPLSCNILQSIQLAKTTYQNPSPQALDLQRASVDSALSHLSARLNSFGQDKASGWRNYLEWEALTTEVNQGEKANVDHLKRFLTHFYQPYVGLEMPEFEQVRHSLRRYIAFLEWVTHSDPRTFFMNKLNEVTDLVSSFDLTNPPPEKMLSLGTLGTWFKDTETASQLVTCMNSLFTYPNLTLSVGASFIPSQVLKKTQEEKDINESQMGADVIGKAYAEVTPHIVFLPDPNDAAFEIRLDGTTVTNTISYEGPVSVSSTLWTTSQGYKVIHLINNQIQTEPAQISSWTSGQINWVDADMFLGARIAERIGWRKANDLLPDIEANASQRVSEQMEQRSDSEISSLMQRVNYYYDHFVLAPLARLGFKWPVAKSSTTSDHLNFGLALSRFDELTAASTPPTPDTLHDLDVSVHESALANLLSQGLSGATFSNLQVVSLIKPFLKKVPSDLEINKDQESWEFSFADKAPFLVRFQEGHLTAKLHLKAFTRHLVYESPREMDKYLGPLTIDASYSPKLSGDLALVRNGNVSVVFGNEISPELSAFIRQKFTALFADELALSLEAVTKSFPPSLSLPTLSLTRMGLEKGWLSVSLDRKTKN